MALDRRLRRFRVSGQPLRVFFAPAAIKPGESIPSALSDALDESQHLVMVCSPAWLASEWCRLETEVSTWRDPSAERRILVPLLLKTCPLPPLLRRLKYLDFRTASKYESAVRELVYTVRTNVRRSVDAYVANRERKAILNEPILPWLGFGGPSFDFLWPEMIIDPFVKPRKHPTTELRLSDWIENQAAIMATSIAIVGEPGVGKTTALRTILLAGGGALPQERIFVHARDLNLKLDSLRERSENSSSSLGIIVDGLDEAGADRMPEVASALADLHRANVTVIVSSRAEFFDRQYDVLRSGLSNLGEILELSRWVSLDILDFTQRYAERIDLPHLTLMVQEILAEVPGAENMLGNPMRLTLLLYLLATGAQIDSLNLQEPYSLYDTFYREWIKKERSRGTGGFEPKHILSAHIAIARWLYENRGEVANLDQLIEGFSFYEAPDLTPDSAFHGLLTEAHGVLDEPILVSFRHETLGEFLIAKDILAAFVGDRERLTQALKVTVGDDVNTFVRSGMLVASKSMVGRYLSNLSTVYTALRPTADASADSSSSQLAERLREQILYYIGRLPLDRCPNILRTAFREETAPLLRRAAGLGAIILDDFRIEQAYMALLDDHREASLNRSVQMVYFADIHGDLHTFEDSGQDWSKTRSAIYKRLAANSLRDIHLRWWDIKTLRSFYQSRQYRDPLTDDEVETLRNAVLEDPSSPERSAALRREHQLLMEELGL